MGNSRDNLKEIIRKAEIQFKNVYKKNLTKSDIKDALEKAIKESQSEWIKGALLDRPAEDLLTLLEIISEKPKKKKKVSE